MTWRAHRPTGIGIGREVFVHAIFAPRGLAQEVVGDGDAAALAVVAAAAKGALVPRRDDTVLVEAGAELHQGSGPVAGAGVVFVAVEHELDRRVRRAREQRHGTAFGAGRELAAEATADELGMDRDARALHIGGAHRLRNLATHAEGRLRAHPQVEVVAAPLRDGTVRLHRAMGLHFRAVGSRVRDRRRRERFVEVAVFAPGIDEFAAVVDHGRIAALQEVDRVRLLFVGHDDAFESVAALIDRWRADCGDFVADKADLLAGVLEADDGCHTGHPARRFEVDRCDLAARDFRAQDHRLKQAGEGDVVGVLCPPRCLGDAVLPIDVSTDDGKLRGGVPRRCVAVRNVERSRFDQRADADLEFPLRRQGVVLGRAHLLPPCAGARRAWSPLPAAVRSTASQMRP